MENVIKNLVIIGAIIMLPILWGCEKDPKPEPNVLSLSPEKINANLGGGEYDLTISTGKPWSAVLAEWSTTATDWCTLSETSGPEGKVITVTVQANNLYEARSVEIRVSSEQELKTVTVEQIALTNTFTISPETIGVDVEGGGYELTISTGVPWTATLSEWSTTDEDWFILSETSGPDGKVITVTVQPNPLYIERSAVINVSSDGETKTAKVIQEAMPDVLSIHAAGLVFCSKGGTGQLTVRCNGPWTATLVDWSSATENWCTLSETSGTGETVITVTVLPDESLANKRWVDIEVSTFSESLKATVFMVVPGENEVFINGLIWSTVNIGEPGTFVDSPDDVGLWYQFNRKVGYPGGPQDDPAPDNWPAEYINDGTAWLPENDPSPAGWRVPTAPEAIALWGFYHDGDFGHVTLATRAPMEQTGFNRFGIIVGIPPEVAATATKDNLKELGGIFLPQSGWRNELGVVDRAWLVAHRTATQLSETHGGMALGDVLWYNDIPGWGDGQKPRAAMIRPVKIITKD